MRCAAALPAHAGLVVRLNSPALPAAKRWRVLPALLDLQLPFPIDQCASAFVDTPAQTVGLAVRHEDLRAALDALASQDMNPERMVPLGWVLWTQAARECPAPDEDQRRAILWTAGDRIAVITGKGTVFGSMATVPSRNPDALRRTLHMAFGGADHALMAFCVGPDAADVARDVAQWPAPWSVTSCPVASPEAFLARSLAVDALLDRGHDAQLRQPPLAHPRRTSAVPRALRTATAGILAGALLLLVANLAARHVIAADEKSAAMALSERLRLVAGYPVNTRGARAVLEAREALAERLDARIERLRAPTAATALLRVLQVAETSAVRLTHVALAEDGLTLSGRSSSPESAEAFAAALRLADFRVRLDADPQPAADGGIAFLMTPEVRE